jgi:CRP-like cAMP-binding protein
MQPSPTISDVLQSAPFAPSLSKAHLLRLRREVLLREIPAGTSLCQKARRADHWTGVVRGVVKIHALSPTGRTTTLATFSPGCWFGEGTLLKREGWPFDATAWYFTHILHSTRGMSSPDHCR